MNKTAKLTGKINNPWTGNTDTVYIERSRYQSNNSLAIMLTDESDGCPYAMLTVNINDSDRLSRMNNGKSLAYVDTNNCPWAPGFIKETWIGEPVGIYSSSGYCMYPLYEFNIDMIHFA